MWWVTYGRQQILCLEKNLIKTKKNQPFYDNCVISIIVKIHKYILGGSFVYTLPLKNFIQIFQNSNLKYLAPNFFI